MEGVATVIPAFASDAEELHFWNTHEPSLKVFAGVRPRPLEQAVRAKDLPER
jgi:hypothetical protein